MNISDEFDTIAAISTPLGTGGVGIIRLSGDLAFEIIKKIFTNPEFEVRKFNYGWIMDGEQKIDEVIILPFFAPNSYTGENVIEIQCHGGMNVVKNILDLVLKNGARLAEKGEFTKRAFLNKKMDLSQAEAVADIIHSKTSKFTKVSVKNLSGKLKNEIELIRKDIFEVLSKMTAAIDFPEDVKEPEYSYLQDSFKSIITKINTVLSDANASNILRQGITVAITGKPNVGKSSLFNSLLKSDRAIVTDIAGTTRDVLKETLDLGIPVTLVDTAGIHQSEHINKVEQIGIEYSKQSINEADLIIFVYDGNQGLQEEDNEILTIIKDKKYLVVANKSDLKSTIGNDIIRVSALTGEGIAELKEKLTEKVCGIRPEELDFVTNKRQQNCLERAKASLEQALLGSEINELQDMISIDVKSALLSLEELTGELITDEILDNIFSHFCIGK
ncbi:MAG: tRNA uridine-5-carboxymethylaminomethyl(34) synthesis GTPase MnmE [bacterium]|nr:tRNA uridine-5-carboxymethylaminomethyl(34) synthesis GTPase MnmE [bacterium]